MALFLYTTNILWTIEMTFLSFSIHPVCEYLQIISFENFDKLSCFWKKFCHASNRQHMLHLEWKDFFFELEKEKKQEKKKMRKIKRKRMEIKKRIGGGTSAAWKVLYQAGR